MEYKVMLECGPHCESWEDVRETLRTSDPVEAIRQSEIHRDRDHHAWIEMVASEAKVERQYRFTASRPNSAMEGECVSFKSLLRRLGDYNGSFPDEITEVHIHKIG